MPGGFADQTEIDRALAQLLGNQDPAGGPAPDQGAPGATQIPAPPDPAATGVPQPPAPAAGDGGAGTQVPGAPQMVSLPDGTTIALDRLQELASLDRAFSTSPDLEREVREVTARRGMFGGPAPVPPPPPAPWAPPSAPQVPTAPPQAGWPAPPPAPVSPYGPGPAGHPASPAAAPAFPALPAEVDPRDPVVAWMAQQTQALQAQQSQLAQMLLSQQAQAAQASSASAATGLARAREAIRSRYPGLSFDELAAMESQAAVQGLGSFYLSRLGDPERAAYTAMEMAGLQDPQLRSKMSAAPPAAQGDAQRRAALSALAGGSGAAPRAGDPAPRKMTAQERNQAMAAEVASMMANN